MQLAANLVNLIDFIHLGQIVYGWIKTNIRFLLLLELFCNAINAQKKKKEKSWPYKYTFRVWERDGLPSKLEGTTKIYSMAKFQTS